MTNAQTELPQLHRTVTEQLFTQIVFHTMHKGYQV